MSTSAVTTCIITAAVCSLLLVAQGQMDDEEWIDPYDILNYDASTKTMRKPAEVSQLPSCNAVFKQFLTKLLKEIEKFGLPSDFQNDLYYDAKVGSVGRDSDSLDINFGPRIADPVFFFFLPQFPFAISFICF
ncbi:hypothetical protein J4Q44_G00045210 [Coregonus suidteri]|uniref:Chloride channel CLIC-like protein 1 n=1 Tax=Coregonus suidteri TaxID=861788 RepID=A0AAN8M992_9TELE